MFKQICHDLILHAFPEIVDLHFVNFNHQNVGQEAQFIDIDTQKTIYGSQGQIILHATSGGAEFRYVAHTKTYGQGPAAPVGTTWSIDFLKRIPDYRTRLELMLKSVYPYQSIRVISVDIPYGMGADFRFDTVNPLGVGQGGNCQYWEISGRDSTSYNSMSARVEANSQLHLPASNAYHLIPVLGQPMPQNSLGNYISRSSVNPGLAVASSTPVLGKPGSVPQTPTITAYGVLNLLEKELSVKTGMLSQVRPMIYQISIGQSQNWQDVIRNAIPALTTLMGDKIAQLNPDFKIIGLDELPGQLDGFGTERATGKVAVHLAYRADSQAHRVTILALVKA